MKEVYRICMSIIFHPILMLFPLLGGINGKTNVVSLPLSLKRISRTVAMIWESHYMIAGGKMCSSDMCYLKK